MTDGMTLNITDFQRKLRSLRKRTPAVLSRALNRSIKSGRTHMARAVSRDMKLKVGTVRERIVVSQATPAKQVAALTPSRRRVPLIEMRASGPFPSRGRGRGVRAAGKRYPNAFIARMASGHRGVYVRTGRARLPITELHGPSVALVFVKHRPGGLARAQEQLVKNLKQEMRRTLGVVA